MAANGLRSMRNYVKSLMAGPEVTRGGKVKILVSYELPASKGQEAAVLGTTALPIQ